MASSSRVCHFVIDVGDLDEGIRFWCAALHGTEEPVNEGSGHIYRRLILPDSEIRILLQLTDDRKSGKSTMHLDIEAEDVEVEVEVERLEVLGATRLSHQTDRGYDFWVMADPWRNEFCVLQPTFPDLLAGRKLRGGLMATSSGPRPHHAIDLTSDRCADQCATRTDDHPASPGLGLGAVRVDDPYTDPWSTPGWGRNRQVPRALVPQTP